MYKESWSEKEVIKVVMNGCPATSARTDLSWLTWSTCFNLITASNYNQLVHNFTFILRITGGAHIPSTFLKTFNANTLSRSSSAGWASRTNHTLAKVPVIHVYQQVSFLPASCPLRIPALAQAKPTHVCAKNGRTCKKPPENGSTIYNESIDRKKMETYQSPKSEPTRNPLPTNS